MMATHRVQLDFSENGFAELQALRAKADAPTNAAIIRNALALYKWYLETTVDRRNEVLVRDKTGEIERVTFVKLAQGADHDPQ